MILLFVSASANIFIRKLITHICIVESLHLPDTMVDLNILLYTHFDSPFKF